MAKRFEMWVLLKIVAMGEFTLALFTAMLLLEELTTMGRLVPSLMYAFVYLVLIWAGFYSIEMAHKKYAEFYRPKKDV